MYPVPAENAVGSIKEECLDRVIPLGERHLRHAIDEFVIHYHRERNHQGIGNQLIDGEPSVQTGEVGCRQRLGGLLRYYYHRAA
jgi:putative transposase